MDELLDSIVILVDTREHEGKHDHILNYFDSKNISWKRSKLDYGDYSGMLPANEKLGIDRDIYFTNEVMVERKANLEELSNNYSSERNRIKAEFASAPPHKVLLVENASYEMMVEGKYDTSYNPKSYWGSMLSMWHKYDMPVIFIKNKQYTGQFIYGFIYYYIRGVLK